MANDIKFYDYSMQVKAEMNDILIAALHEASNEICSQTAKNTRVDSGQLKGSWDYVVDDSNLESTMGSPLENAIWEEFGTGIYGLNGRQTPWSYQDIKGEWHTTRGKKGTKAFEKAFTSLKSAIISMFQDKMKGL